jgi:hypothetical protein
VVAVTAVYRKLGGRPVNAASIKKSLVMSQPIFKPKHSIMSSQGRFSWKINNPDYAATSFQDFKRQ